jgi:hypothetical protein
MFRTRTGRCSVLGVAIPDSHRLTAKDYLNSWTASGTYQVQWEPVPKRQKHLAVGPGQGM